jgi:hypothetical protein
METILAFGSFFVLIAVWIVAPDAQKKVRTNTTARPIYRSEAKAA